MNDFERKITSEYIKCFPELSKNAQSIAEEFSDIASYQEIFNNEMDAAIRLRISYLAVKEYHQILSKYLESTGISLPDFETLVSTR